MLLMRGDITGPGNLIKVGNALQNLSGTCAADTTTVAGGALAINGTLTCPTVTVELNAFLKGAGTILGSVVVQKGATLAPGNSIGTLGVANATFLPGLYLSGRIQCNLSRSSERHRHRND